MDIYETWETIDSKVDWFLTGIISLLLLNLLVPVYVGWEYMNLQSFHDKFNLQESDIFVEKAKMLEDLPSMDDIEVEPHQAKDELPEGFAALQESTMFLPAGSTDIGELQTVQTGGGTEAEGEGEQTEPREPPITGYEIVGRITGKGELKASVIRKLSSESDGGGAEESAQPTFIAREGEYLQNSDVKVVDISDTSVQLDMPGHRVTTFQFEIDKISQKIRQSITLQ